MHKLLATAAAAALLAAGCTNPNTGQTNRTVTGAAIGAAAGGVLGAVVGDDDNTLESAAIGAAVGGLAGGLIGNYLDRQQAELAASLQNTGTTVVRTEETIVINVPANVSFATNSAQIQPSFYPTLDSIARTLVQYPQSYVDITGHTDITGTAAYNQQLSEQRASAIASYLVSRGVAQNRIIARGVGSSQPVAPNDTEAGRSQNRRVEIEIRPFTA